VDIGGRVTASSGGVNIVSQENMHTNGITAGDKVKLLTTGDGKTITLGAMLLPLQRLKMQ
jgi:hypothetical protein